MSNTPLNADDELLTKMRRLGEKYYGNELYGEHLQYQHELQKLLLADRKKHELQARIETATDILYGFSRTYKQEVTDSDGNMYVNESHDYISKYEVQELVEKLKQELEKL